MNERGGRSADCDIIHICCTEDRKEQNGYFRETVVDYYFNSESVSVVFI